ncbi:MAG: PadR family transcriptional regulator [Aestuariivirgaceae bacterium]
MNIRTLCLGILSVKEATGYEIKKMVEEGMFSHFIDASYGSIYPALTQMLSEGLLSVRAEGQSGKPDKKVYAITARGREALADALHVSPRPDKFKSEFLFQMLLMDLLGGHQLAQIYDERLSDLTAELARIEACGSASATDFGRRFVNGYGQAVVGAAVQYLQKCREELLSEAAARTANAAE